MLKPNLECWLERLARLLCILLALCVVPCCAVAQSDLRSMPLSYASVRGRVMNAANNRPLPRTLVRIEGNAATGALTDGEGRFEIPGIPVGQQMFRLTRPGFLDRAMNSEGVSSGGDTNGHSVLVAADMPELVFWLTPASAIRGHVELSTGDPGDAIPVTLLRRTIDNGRSLWSVNGYTKTNSEGNYHFSALGAGTYVVYTSATMDSDGATTLVDVGSVLTLARSGYPSIYYPAARDLSTAALIPLRAGDQAPVNIELPLEPFHTVAAKVVLASGSSERDRSADRGRDSAADSLPPLQNPDVTISDSNGHLLPYSGQFDSTTETVQANLPDGSFTLTLSATTRPRSLGTEANAVILTGSIDLSLDARPLPTLRLPLVPLEPIPVHLHLPPSYERQQQRLRNSSREPTAPSPATTFFTSIDGLSESLTFTTLSKTSADTLEILPVASGSFWASSVAGTSGLCIGSFVAGSTDLAREPLVLSPSVSAPSIELTLRDDCASLNLELPYFFTVWPGIEPTFTVYIVPDSDSTEVVPSYTLRPSSGGTLSVQNLTPGSYHVYTFTAPVELEYHNAAAMIALPSQAITLAPGASSNLILEVPVR